MKNKRELTTIKTIWLMSLASCLTIFATANAPTRQTQTIASRPTASQNEISRSPASVRKTCVLVYERKESSLWRNLQKKFKNHREVTLVYDAKPTDMVKCALAHNPHEIVIYAHTMKARSGKTKLAYFAENSDAAAAEQHQKVIAKVKQQYAYVVSKNGYGRCENKRKLQYPCNSIQRQELQLRHKLAFLKNLKPTHPAYRMAYSYKQEPFSENSFQDLHTLVKTSNLNLQKIRLMSGQRRQVLKSYPELRRLAYERRIKVQNPHNYQMVSSSEASRPNTLRKRN